MIYSDIDVQASRGFTSAFRAAGQAFSPLSEGEVWLSESHPGLSGIVRFKGRDAIVIFVDEFTPSSSLVYSVIGKPPASSEEPPLYRVHVQNGLYAWQFDSRRLEKPDFGENPLVFFIQWKSGFLRQAIEYHDEAYVRRIFDEGVLITGSDFEKESLSRLHLATGESSIAQSLASGGALASVHAGKGQQVALGLDFALSGFSQRAVGV